MWDSKSKKTRFCTTYEHVFMAFMSFECKLFNFQLYTKKIGILIADFYFGFFGIGLFKVWLQGGGKIK
jgi:hypothetical protein